MRGKVVLITGASSGIGAGTAVHFAAKGCLLSLTDRNESGLQDTLEACIQAGTMREDILLVTADLEVFENLAPIVQKTVDKFGRLDVLVNNAGCSAFVDFDKTTSERYDTVMNTNLKAVFFLTQAALPHLIESKGNVVNVSSVASTQFLKEIMAYSLTKVALDHFTKLLALAVATKNVRVNSVNPGGVETPIFEKMGYPTDFEKMIKSMSAMKRGGTIEEIAKSIAFLADDDQSSYITGVTLLVDGGGNLLGPQFDVPKS